MMCLFLHPDSNKTIIHSYPGDSVRGDSVDKKIVCLWNNNKDFRILTSMYSSRMHTVRLLTISQHALGKGEVSAQGGIPLGPEADTSLWTEWLTDRCKNITLPQLHCGR